jgi:hypothetical protein
LTAGEQRQTHQPGSEFQNYTFHTTIRPRLDTRAKALL